MTSIPLPGLGLVLAAALALGSMSRAQATPLPLPVTDADYYADGRPDPDKVELGRLLFFDKLLSGNRNIACATCHHPALASGDALPLPLGEGPSGLGKKRHIRGTGTDSIAARVPRNSPGLFNLGAREFTRLFHDGRVELDVRGYFASGFISPAKWKLPAGLDNVLAAQAMFPVASPAEMAGDKGENPIADAAALNNVAGPGGVWELLAECLQAISEYVDRFKRAYPEQIEAAQDISFVFAANAIAAFEAVTFRADGSPFDRHLRGDRASLGAAARRGMRLFYGKAGCGSCHAGKFQSDHQFHAIAMPQIGPGKGDGADGSYWRATGINALLEDFGRGRVTFREQDRYKFRTPSLRNVALTGPWGHDGAFDSLEAVVRHHLDPIASLDAYVVPARHLPELNDVVELTAAGSSLSQVRLTGARRDGYLRRDTWVQQNPELRGRIAAANELAPLALTDAEVADLLAFLDSLTDPATDELRFAVPARVPSGLPIED